MIRTGKKKTIMLSLIVVILVAGTMVSFAGTNDHQWQGGPTCDSNGYNFNLGSNITIKPGFEAEAYSFDATFCGAPCRCTCSEGASVAERLISATTKFDGVDYGSITYSDSQGDTYNASGIVISGLEITSNISRINVTVTVTQPSSNGTTPGGSHHTTFYAIFNRDTSSTNPPSGMELDNGNSGQKVMHLYSKNGNDNSPYIGDVVVVMDTSNTYWGRAPKPGRYIITTTFEITPVTDY